MTDLGMTQLHTEARRHIAAPLGLAESSQCVCRGNQNLPFLSCGYEDGPPTATRETGALVNLCARGTDGYE